MSQDVESIVAVRTHSERRMGRHQRVLEWLTTRLGRPAVPYVILIGVGSWIALNTLWPFAPRPVPDPAPYFWLQGAVALSGLLMTTLVLITENRQSRDAEHRAHLDLQVNLVTEQKVAKLVALIEELRRDLPMVRDRVDVQAERMQEVADPERLLEAIERIDAAVASGGLEQEEQATEESERVASR